MTSLIDAIPRVRSSVVAILRVHLSQPERKEKGKTLPAKLECSFGSAYCVSEDRYLITAHHLLNGGKERNLKDRFYAFTVPDNGANAFYFPVTGFPVERQGLDVAVLEIGPCATPDIHLPALPVSFEPIPDGAVVATVGYPAPKITKVNIDAKLNYQGGNFFLKSHANEGIVAARYELSGNQMYELNVGWHHGESGGPIVSITDELFAFSLMQSYRNIESPHGNVAGPHQGIALSAIKDELEELGVEPV